MITRTLAIIFLSIVAFSANADGHHGGYYGHHEHHVHHGYHGGHHSNNNWWVAPAIIGGIGAITYGLSQPYYQHGYHYETMWDYNCNCYREILVPN